MADNNGDGFDDVTGLPVGGGGTGGGGGFLPGTIGGANPGLPSSRPRPNPIGGALSSIFNSLPPAVREQGQQIDEFHWLGPDGRVYELTRGTDGQPTWSKFTAGDSKGYLDAVIGGGGSSGGGGQRLAGDDPRYWDLQYQKLYQDQLNLGLDAETSRRNALTQLVQARDSLAADTAQTSANVAKTAAEFAANPRDAVAELMYRNQVGGVTPFGDMTNQNFGEYGKALADKAASIFQPVSQDLNFARQYRDAIPRDEFFGAEDRSRLGLQPTPAQQLLPKFDMGGIINSRPDVGHSPTSSEGGLNMNIFEPWVAVGMDSGKVLFSGSEPRPDGSRRGEQIKISPLPSEKEKDKKLADGEKAVTQSFGVPKAAEGGVVNATPDDFMAQLSQYLGSLGGSRGGTGGFTTPLPSLRLLAGDPYNTLLQDPDALNFAKAGYGSLGISDENFDATIKKFTPRGIINNSPRLSFA